MRASSTLKLSLVSLLVLAACGDSKSTEPTVVLKPTIIISSTTDPTSELIAEIYGQALEKAEFRIARKKAFATSGELLAAMAAGKVQLAGHDDTERARAAGFVQSFIHRCDDPSTPCRPDLDAVVHPGGEPQQHAQQAAEIVKGLPENLEIGTPTTAEDKDVVFCAKTFTDSQHDRHAHRSRHEVQHGNLGGT